MSEFERNTIIAASFANESAAIGALAGLEHWADTRRDIKLGAVGAMSNENGEISTELVREADQGSLVSGAMGLAKTLLGPATLVGNVVGGVAQSLRREPDKEVPEPLKKLGEQMEAGLIALVMVGTADEAGAYKEQLELMCGAVTLYEVPQEVLQEIAAAVEAAKAQTEAQEEAAKEAEKEAEKAEKEAEKAAKKAEKDAEKAAKEAEREAEKAAKEAEKAAKKEERRSDEEENEAEG